MRTYALLGVSLVIFFALVSPTSATDPAPPITPTDELNSVGLSTNPKQILDYLAHGIPPDFINPKNGRAILVPERFALYSPMVRLLTKDHAEAAAPILSDLINGKISPVIQADVDAAVSELLPPRTWDDWALISKWQLDDLRFLCAWTLNEFTSQPAIPFTEQLLAEWTPILLRELDKGRPGDNRERLHAILDVVNFHNSLISRLTENGSKAGIDALISTLDHPNTPALTPNVLLLQSWTGQSFGPEFDDVPAAVIREVEKWKKWWATNRDAYVAANLPQNPLLGKPLPEPQFVRDHLVRSLGSPHPYYSDGMEFYSGSSWQWLEQNGDPLLLRRIIDDEDERPSIRAAAIYFYANRVREASIPLLEKYSSLPNSLQTQPIRTKAVATFHFLFPKQAEPVVRSYLESDAPEAALGIIRDLARTPEGQRYLHDVFNRLSSTNQLTVLDETGFSAITTAPHVVDAALLGSDPLIAEAVANHVFMDRLSPQARAALDRWQNNIEFRLWQLKSNSRWSTQYYEKMLSDPLSTEPYAAVAYAVTEEMLSRNYRNRELEFGTDEATLDLLIHMARDGFLGSLRAYRESQGRHEPLPEYGF